MGRKELVDRWIERQPEGVAALEKLGALCVLLEDMTQNGSQYEDLTAGLFHMIKEAKKPLDELVDLGEQMALLLLTPAEHDAKCDETFPGKK